MEMILTATLSRLYCVLGDCHTSTVTLVRVFWFLPLFHWH